MRHAIAIFVFALAATGCTNQARMRAQEQAQVQRAYLAGQNEVLQQELKTPSVEIVGPVQNHEVPWVAGLTLAQAIATADYLDSHAPSRIIITRQGENATLDPSVLLNGAVVPLEPDDVIELQVEPHP